MINKNDLVQRRPYSKEYKMNELKSFDINNLHNFIGGHLPKYLTDVIRYNMKYILSLLSVTSSIRAMAKYK